MKPEESMDIISKMVSDTRNSVLKNAYVPFLTWGCTTVVVAMLVYFLRMSYNSSLIYLCWFLIPVIGIPLTRLCRPRSRLIRTRISISLQSIWWMLTVLLVSFSAATFVLHFNILFFILLLLSIGSFVTGAILSYPFLKYSSIPGFIVSAFMLLISGDSQIPIFAAAIAVMMIIPGYKMKQDYNNL
ncbi:MAG: hypothetical protein K2H60_11455 [Muribaculaceae bacterium]|nr:hypothetical protein [Muribaculaceae bacterium]